MSRERVINVFWVDFELGTTLPRHKLANRITTVLPTSATTIAIILIVVGRA